MKRFICLLAAMLFTVSLAACNSGTPTGETNPTEEVKIVADSGDLIVGLDNEFPPMGFLDDNGELTGFDVDMATEAIKRMGYTPKFQAIDWDSKEMELFGRRIDLIWNGLTITPVRKAQMLFSNPYLKNKQVILVKKDSGISNKADLSGKIVGLQRGSTAVDAVEADQATLATFDELMEYDDNIMAFTDLGIGRLGAVVVDEIVAKYYLANNDTDFVLLEENFGDEEYGVATRPQETILMDKLKKVLTEMYDDGTSAEISKKWFGDNIVVN